MNTVLITGVSRGIGKALTEKFLSESWFVIGTSTSGKVNFEHENLTVFKLDLSSSASIDSCARVVIEQGVKLDILINNAGHLDEAENTALVQTEILRKTLEVNLIGTISFTQQLLEQINNGGHILNVSSRMGSLNYISHPRDPSYRISKAALNMFTRILSLQLKERNITVSSLHPGWVKTDMGGMDADLEPAESAEDIYKLAISKPETGQFWFKGEKFPW